MTTLDNTLAITEALREGNRKLQSALEEIVAIANDCPDPMISESLRMVCSTVLEENSDLKFRRVSGGDHYWG